MLIHEIPGLDLKTLFWYGGCYSSTVYFSSLERGAGLGSLHRGRFCFFSSEGHQLNKLTCGGQPRSSVNTGNGQKVFSRSHAHPLPCYSSDCEQVASGLVGLVNHDCHVLGTLRNRTFLGCIYIYIYALLQLHQKSKKHQH